MTSRTKLISLAIAAALAFGIGTYAVTASAHDTTYGSGYGMMGGYRPGYGPGYGHMWGYGPANGHMRGYGPGYGHMHGSSAYGPRTRDGYGPGQGYGMMGPGTMGPRWYGN